MLSILYLATHIKSLMNAIHFIDWWKLNVILYNEAGMMSMI